MRAAVVFNPVKVDRKALARAIEGAQPEDWDEALWFETAEDDQGKQAAEDARDAGVDVVLVAGGDGTVRVAAEALAGSDTALALVPSGTGNLLARNLGIDVTFLRASVRTAFDGRDRPIDLGWTEFERPDGEQVRHGFAVIAGFGLDAAMIENTDDELKKRVGWLAYVDAIVKSVKRIKRAKMRYRVDGDQQRTVGLNTLMVGNCGALQGNVVLLPDAEVDDGRLDVAIVRPDDLFGWLQVAKFVAVNSAMLHRVLRRQKLVGPQKNVPTLGYGQCERFDARLDGPMPVQVDGDAFGEAVAMRFTVQRHALTVKVPQPFGEQAAAQLGRIRDSFAPRHAAGGTRAGVPAEPESDDADASHDAPADATEDATRDSELDAPAAADQGFPEEAEDDTAPGATPPEGGDDAEHGDSTAQAHDDAADQDSIEHAPRDESSPRDE